MATIRGDETKKIQVKVETGVNASGSRTFSVRTLSNISDQLTDDDARVIGSAYGALQTYPVDAISLAETAVLLEE